MAPTNKNDEKKTTQDTGQGDGIQSNQTVRTPAQEKQTKAEQTKARKAQADKREDLEKRAQEQRDAAIEREQARVAQANEDRIVSDEPNDLRTSGTFKQTNSVKAVK